MAYFYMFRQIWHYAGADRWRLALGVFVHLLSHFSSLAQPLIFAKILNVLQVQGPNAWAEVKLLILYWIGIYIWFTIFHRGGQYLILHCAYRVQQRFTRRHYEVLTTLPLQWHADHHSGDTINRIKTAADVLRQFAERQAMYSQYLMLFWGPLIALAAMQWQVAVIALVIALASVAVMHWFDRKLIVFYKQMNAFSNKATATFFDYVSNMRTVLTLRLGDRTTRELEQRIDDGYRPFMQAEAIVNSTKWFFVSSFVLFLQLTVILYYVFLQLQRPAGVLVGNVAAVFQYLTQLSNTYMNIARDYQQLISWRTDYEQSLPILAALPMADAQDDATAKNWQHIEIAGLSFDYEGNAAPITIEGLVFKRGEKVALVGESGAGKSTLMALLRGLIVPQGGQLLIDGQAHEISMLNGMTTLIPQDPEIFENTIRFNITFGLDLSEGEVMQMIALARFEDVLARLPNGLDADVREKGVTLSGGERQRLALARGLLAARDSEIILLDEATSSVDIQNETQIMERLLALYADKLVIASVHKLNTLHHYDRVLVMQQGRIVQDGLYADLAAQDGLLKTMLAHYSPQDEQ